MQNQIPCPHCGHLNLPTDDVCLSCGQALVVSKPVAAVPHHASSPTTQPLPVPEDRTRLIVSVILLTLVGGAIIWALIASGLWRLVIMEPVLGVLALLILGGIAVAAIQRQRDRMLTEKLKRQPADAATIAVEMVAMDAQIEAMKEQTERLKRTSGRGL